MFTEAFVDVADHIGEPSFGDSLVALLNRVCDVEHLVIYGHAQGGPSPIMTASLTAPERVEAASRRFLERYIPCDPLLPAVRAAAASRQPRLFRAEIGATPHRELFDLVGVSEFPGERLVVSGHAGDNMLSVSLGRPGRCGRLDAATADEMLGMFPLVLSFVAKHSKLTVRPVDTATSLSSLSRIEDCLAHSGAVLSPRQAQVCARILFGMSTDGIALDLDVSAETVVTHRKLAYRRLNIATQFELTRWYLGEWGRQARA